MSPQYSASVTPGGVEVRPNRLEVDRLLDDPRTRIIVCCGSGGVGKTTTAAALGLRAAERGRHVVVLTVDPARRLAQSMGLSSLDTPPSRSALDFLDAPQRLSRFLDGRLIKLLTAPTRAGGRAYMKVVNVSFGVFTGIVTKIIGAQVLRDVQTFVAAFDTMFGGFRERAEDTYRLLQTPGTAFLVVATPEPDALREASYFVERL